MRILFCVSLAGGLLACSGSASAPAPEAPGGEGGEAPEVSTGASGEPNAEVSEHRVGDRVVYRYEGSYSEAPVILTEEITEVEGLRLTMTVEATRGEERRRWIQVVTDTEENRDNNVVDELYEVVDGERRRLPNEGNADLMRLYGWTLPPCGPPVTPLPTEARHLEVGGEGFDCECESLRMRCAEREATLITCECPDFVWGHAFGEARFTDEQPPDEQPPDEQPPGEEPPFWSVTVSEQARGG